MMRTECRTVPRNADLLIASAQSAVLIGGRTLRNRCTRPPRLALPIPPRAGAHHAEQIAETMRTLPPHHSGWTVPALLAAVAQREATERLDAPVAQAACATARRAADVRRVSGRHEMRSACYRRRSHCAVVATWSHVVRRMGPARESSRLVRRLPHGEDTRRVTSRSKR